MSQELLVKPQTEIAVRYPKTDVLALYGVPTMLNQIVKKEKVNLLNKMNCAAVIVDSLNKLSDSEGFTVVIPKEFRELINSGRATFDKSGKNPEGYTPNIRIKGQTGIQGQATIVQKTDSQVVTQSISNLAMMAIVQSVLEKLNGIEEKVEDIKKGQQDDRISTIIGPFKGFMDLYPSFKTSAELDNAANTAYLDMQRGLANLHLQIDADRKRLNNAPSNSWEAFWIGIHLFHNETERYQKCYERFVYNIQLYNRLILLADIVLHLKGADEVIKENHKKMVDYCNANIDDSFKKDMHFLMNGKTTDINNIIDYNKNLGLTIDGAHVKDICIECEKEDIKYLNF